MFMDKKVVETQKYNKSIQDSFSVYKKESKRKNIGVGVGGTLLGILIGGLLFR